jgi:hypothetical protein
LPKLNVHVALKRQIELAVLKKQSEDAAKRRKRRNAFVVRRRRRWRPVNVHAKNGAWRVSAVVTLC